MMLLRTWINGLCRRTQSAEETMAEQIAAWNGVKPRRQSKHRRRRPCARRSPKSICMPELIAQTRSRVVNPSGEEGVYTIGISSPIKQKTGEYGCDVVLPDSADSRTIYGEDSLQSLSLAMRFSADRINDMIAKGWRFYYPSSNDEIPFEAYFMHPEWISRLEGIGRREQNPTNSEQADAGNRAKPGA
jgi:hypothetical protein